MQTFDYKAPNSLDEALALLKEHGDEAELIAGGTALIIMMQQGLVQPKVVIGLSGVKELRGVRRTADGGLVFGATTTHRELETSPEAFAYDAQLPKALGVIATIRIRNQATVGGNLVHADPAQDPPPVLIALDGTCDIVSKGGNRTLPIEEFFLDYLPRTEDDFATVSVAVRLGVGADKKCNDIRVGLGSLGTTPLRGKAVENALKGKVLTPALIKDAAALVRDEVDPLDDVRGSAKYKREMARVWTERTIATLAGFQTAGAVR